MNQVEFVGPITGVL